MSRWGFFFFLGTPISGYVSQLLVNDYYLLHAIHILYFFQNSDFIYSSNNIFILKTFRMFHSARDMTVTQGRVSVVKCDYDIIIIQ